jgi:hypothetical protein
MLFLLLCTLQDHSWQTAAGTPCGNAMDKLEAAMGPVNEYDILGPCFYQGGGSGLQVQLLCMFPITVRYLNVVWIVSSDGAGKQI